MTNEADKLQQYETEWRQGVTTKLDALTTKIDSFPTIFANKAEISVLKTQVEILEGFKNKLIGGSIALNTCIGFVLYFLLHH